MLLRAVRSQSGFPAERITYRRAGAWAFADVSGHDRHTLRGSGVRITSAILRLRRGRWQVVYLGDLDARRDYRRRMPPGARRAFDRWHYAPGAHD